MKSIIKNNKSATTVTVLAQLTVNFNGTLPKIERQVSITAKPSRDHSQTIEQICDGLETFGKFAGQLLCELLQ